MSKRIGLSEPFIFGQEYAYIKECLDTGFFHITDLIAKVKSKGKRVGVFPIENDAWIDIGQWEEYRSALKRLS